MPQRFIISFASILLALVAAPLLAGDHCVPFKGSSEQQAVSAVPVDEGHVFVTTAGEGNATHLGHFTFISPHLSGLSDFSIDGTQTFTAANGDKLEATIVGQLHPFVDETGHVFLVGDVQGTITGGTGRFEDATGDFIFSLTFDTQTFHSTATIDGTICFPRK